MTSYLIIPDIHNHVETAEELAKLYPDRTSVFLGDYFDNWNDWAGVARTTAEWLRHSLNQPNRIHLMGNHDLPYRWNSQTCPGFTREKKEAISKVMRQADWEQILFYHVIQKDGLRPLVLSHAGFTLCNLYGLSDNEDVARATRYHQEGRMHHLALKTANEYIFEIGKQSLAAKHAAEAHIDHHFLYQGDRMGELNIGGPFWLDKDSVRNPLPGIDQIVGHSIVNYPKCLSVPNRTDSELDMWFIDGAGKYAALVDLDGNGRGGLKVTPIHAKGKQIGKPCDAV